MLSGEAQRVWERSHRNKYVSPRCGETGAVLSMIRERASSQSWSMPGGRGQGTAPRKVTNDEAFDKSTRLDSLPRAFNDGWTRADDVVISTKKCRSHVLLNEA
jgi:hypothetical protein